LAMRLNRLVVSGIAALLLAGCAYTVEVDGIRHDVRIYPLATTPPDETATPPPATPTFTSTAPPTTTPTLTPMPTVTPIPGSATPTQEATPGATEPPGTVEPATCIVKTRGFAVNERTDHAVTAPKTEYSPIPPASTVMVYEFWQGPTYLWARNVYGWFAVRAGSSWWVDGVEGTTETCVDVPGWPDGLPPPAPIVALPNPPNAGGFHVLMGQGASSVLLYADRIPEWCIRYLPGS